MAANSSVTEPDHKKPKLDDVDKDAAETKETLESAKPGTSTESGDDYIDSDDDLAQKLCPRDFESGELVELCELALAHYQVEHPGESYKFESGHGGQWWFNLANEYHLEFCAKKADGSIQNFEATTVYHDFDEPEKFVVEKCVLLKDGVVEPIDRMEKMGIALGRIAELSLKDLEEKEYNEYAKIVEFCKSALTFYEKDHLGESYEFVVILKVKRGVLRGFEYILVFHAKKKADSTPATFKACVYNLIRATYILKCELR